ncbi:MAG: HD domain-containing protein [Proteobacteria bacterium]|nr:HD domain-containing protein [Pseudomonadota bacterium]
MKTVSFTEMKHGTRDDYLLLRDHEEAHFAGTADRLLRELSLQGEETIPGYPVTRLEHALQSATRAVDAGADIDWIVATLLHDIGDGLAPQNHDKFAAEVLRPFVREEVTWVVEQHGIFQMVYYGQHYGWDPNEREKFASHPYYQTCVDFCELWDQSSFDPAFESKPLEYFTPIVHEVFARNAYDDTVLCPNEARGLLP